MKVLLSPDPLESFSGEDGVAPAKRATADPPDGQVNQNAKADGEVKDLAAVESGLAGSSRLTLAEPEGVIPGDLVSWLVGYICVG